MRGSKLASLRGFMSLEPGATALYPQATGKEKNDYGMQGGVSGEDRGKMRRKQRERIIGKREIDSSHSASFCFKTQTLF